MLNVKTAPDTIEAISDDVLDDFEKKIRGDVLRPDDERYDEARKIWNGMFDKYPAAIVQCQNTADVVTAVNLAREHDLLVSVRGGGHNVAGHAVCDDGLMIDLSQMKGIHVNPHSRTARVQPGVDLGDLDSETQLFDLATPTGIVSETGLAGLTLGGGFGWLTRKYGFTADNLLSAEVVTADGSVVQASEEDNADLFWGIRGAGGNFGIVTSFEYRLHPLDRTVLGGVLIHPMERATDLLRYYREFTARAPRELGSLFVVRLAPPAPFLPEAVHGKPICGIIVCYAGDVEDGERVLQPLRDFGEPLADKIGPKSYVAMQSMLDQGQTDGHQYYSKTEYLPQLRDEPIETIVTYAATISSPITRVVLMQHGGAVRDWNEMDAAVSHRDAEFVLALNNGWSDPADDERQIQWTRDFWTAIRPFATVGAYVNFLSADEGQDRVRAAYGDEKYRRLVQLKNKYDPTNFFRLNQNIRPSV
ncbi:MAG TPA: FAD-binding oxidoreductase [Candidatus Sulfomarinibacteraceae bacterium]|nr:FAD-binding oxidoreductase [Candidatus Sulfomarinibacteraceae bacterium]